MQPIHSTDGHPCTEITQLSRGWLRTLTYLRPSPWFVTNIPWSAVSLAKSLLIYWSWFLIWKPERKPDDCPNHDMTLKMLPSPGQAPHIQQVEQVWIWIPHTWLTLPTKQCRSPSGTTRMESLANDVIYFQHTMKGVSGQRSGMRYLGNECSGETRRRTLQRNIFKRFDGLDILYNPISKKALKFLT